MPVSDSSNPTALRRRTFLLTLGLRPADLRVGARLPPAWVTHVLSGAERLTRDEAARFTRRAGKKIVELFG